MQPIIVVVDEKRRVMIDLPDDIPTGRVEIIVRPLPDPADEREAIRARLIAAGHLSNIQQPVGEYQPLSDAERAAIAEALAGEKSTLDRINEDREERL